MGEVFVGFDIGVLVAKGDKAIHAAIGVMNAYPDFLVGESRGIKLYFLVGGGIRGGGVSLTHQGKTP
ncbi:hypothetical protein ES708_26549 [subsurface metagenome]